MEKLFELSCQDQTLNPQVGTFTDASQTTGTFTPEDGEYYLTNGDTKGFYTYKPIALQPGLVDDSKVIIEFDLKVVTASVNTHAIIGTYAGVDGNGIPTGAKITLQYNAGDIELVLGSGTTETLIESADVVVDQWYHFRIDCALTAAIESTYGVKIDGTAVATVTGATTDYELGIIGVLGTDLHACDECGIKNITLVTETNMYVGRTALEQALQDVKGYVDTTKIPLAGSNQISGDLIPSTDNAYTLGDSTYGFASFYANKIYLKGGEVYGDMKKIGLYSIYGNDPDYKFFNGAGASFISKDFPAPSMVGMFEIYAANNGSSAIFFRGKPDGTLTWNGQPIQYTSDQRLKQQINQIDDKLLDAWEDVDLVQFKYNDAVDTKKDNARLHTGYVVQQIDKACKSHGVDISQYGLYCHEEYPQETEEVEVEQADGTKVKETKVIREASEHYSLRYTEVYAVECMYLRRCIARLTARIEELEKGKEQEASK